MTKYTVTFQIRAKRLSLLLNSNTMERRLCTLICAMFFFFASKKNKSKNKYAKMLEYLLHHNLRNVFLGKRSLTQHFFSDFSR